MAPEWLFCFSVATRLGGINVVPLIQIKKIHTRDRHCAHEVCEWPAFLTHIHLFRVARLLPAMIDIPDFGTPLRSIAGSVEKIPIKTLVMSGH